MKHSNGDLDKEKKSLPTLSTVESNLNESTRPKRQKTEKFSCVVCGKERHWDRQEKTFVHKLFRLCEAYSAQKLINAADLNKDDIYTRIIFCYSSDDPKKAIFARDTYYHNSCLRKYFRAYDRRIQEIMENLGKEDESRKDNLLKTFRSVMSTLDLTNNAYSVTYLRDEMNKILSDSPVRNRSVKNLLLQNYEHLCFTYPRRKSQ